jgi:hypothetical protein
VTDTAAGLWATLEAQDDARWERIAEKMRAAGFCPYTRGGVLLVPTNRAVGSLPWWAMWSTKHDALMMTRLQPVDPEHLRPMYAEHEGPLLDLDELLGKLVTAVLKHAERGGADDEAGVDEVKDIQRRVRQMVAAEKGAADGSCTMGVGDGTGSLFVHGSYEAIKACQRLIDRSPAEVYCGCGDGITESVGATCGNCTAADDAAVWAQGRRRPDGERMLEIARATGLREHLHGLAPQHARPLLATFVRAATVPRGQAPEVGDRIKLIGHSAWPEATVTEVTERGFKWRFDAPHVSHARLDLVIESGEEFSLDGWALIATAAEAGKQADPAPAAPSIIPLPVVDTVTRP